MSCPGPRLAVVFAAMLLAAATGWAGEIRDFPAPDGRNAQRLVIYSSLDIDLAAPLIAAFQADRPGVAVRYEDLLTGELHDRIVKESRAGGPTADFAFSSAMDLQVKLANDGFARPVVTPDTADWPGWANWRNTVYALTFEPAVFAYYKPAFAGRPVPATRADLVRWLESYPAEARGKIGTYDVSRSGVGYLFLARDQELYPGIWSVVEAMAKADVQQFATSGELLDRLADGRLIFGYNLLGSYVAEVARRRPTVGMVLPRDFTVVVSRVALVPSAAASPDLGAEFLAFLMSPAGQELLSRELRLPAVSLEVSGRKDDGDGGPMDIDAMRLTPVPVSPGLLAYLDQATRKRLIDRWQQAFTGN